jgi:hypothetical protein
MLVIYLKLGEGWIFVWESGEAVIVFLELIVGCSELGDLL